MERPEFVLFSSDHCCESVKAPFLPLASCLQYLGAYGSFESHFHEANIGLASSFDRFANLDRLSAWDTWEHVALGGAPMMTNAQTSSSYLTPHRIGSHGRSRSAFPPARNTMHWLESSLLGLVAWGSSLGANALSFRVLGVHLNKPDAEP